MAVDDLKPSTLWAKLQPFVAQMINTHLGQLTDTRRRHMIAPLYGVAVSGTQIIIPVFYPAMPALPTFAHNVTTTTTNATPAEGEMYLFDQNSGNTTNPVTPTFSPTIERSCARVRVNGLSTVNMFVGNLIIIKLGPHTFFSFTC